MLIHDFLLLERPPAWDVGSLRYLCGQFLKKDVQSDPVQFIDRSIDFYAAAAADVLIEEMIDRYMVASRALPALPPGQDHTYEAFQAAAGDFEECCGYERATDSQGIYDELFDMTEFTRKNTNVNIPARFRSYLDCV